MNEDPTTTIESTISSSLLRTVLMLGHLCLITLVAIYVATYLMFGKPYDQAWRIIFLSLTVGRAAAVGACAKMGFSMSFIFYQIIFVDIIFILYLYPLFAKGFKHITQLKYIGGYLKSAHELAAGYKSTVAPYGAVGLTLFVACPLWSTGPLVGTLVGFIIGLPSAVVLTAVTLGNILATVFWIWLYDWLDNWSSLLSLILVIVVFVLSTVGLALAGIKSLKKNNHDVPEE
jgi:uncharacterized membrane protein